LGVLALDDGVDGSKKIERNSLAPVGGCIRLAGTGCNLGGETLGCPSVAQPEIASAQISDNASLGSERISLVLFVLCRDVVECVRLLVLGGPCGFRCLGRELGNVLRLDGVLRGDCGKLGLVVAHLDPLPADDA